MRAFITGVAGFIGFHAARALSAKGWDVAGVDNFNPYYPPALKRARRERLGPGIRVFNLDIVDHDALTQVLIDEQPDVIIHLAAQAGVRHSLSRPFDYAQANVVGHLSVLEAARRVPNLSHLVYASSSSVYGGPGVPVPFTESHPSDAPISLYAVTKRADEMMSASYAHLYGLRQVGLRFFTVYGEWGRPDMAYWIFAEKILAGAPIKVFNGGRMRRDFTFIDDIVAGVCAVAEKEPKFSTPLVHETYNIGNNRPAELLDVIDILERAAGRKAELVMEDMQPGEVLETYADIAKIRAAYGYSPRIGVEEGLPRFVHWYRAFRERGDVRAPEPVDVAARP